MSFVRDVKENLWGLGWDIGGEDGFNPAAYTYKAPDGSSVDSIVEYEVLVDPDEIHILHYFGEDNEDGTLLKTFDIKDEDSALDVALKVDSWFYKQGLTNNG